MRQANLQGLLNVHAPCQASELTKLHLASLCGTPPRTLQLVLVGAQCPVLPEPVVQVPELPNGTHRSLLASHWAHPWQVPAVQVTCRRRRTRGPNQCRFRMCNRPATLSRQCRASQVEPVNPPCRRQRSSSGRPPLHQWCRCRCMVRSHTSPSCDCTLCTDLCSCWLCT